MKKFYFAIIAFILITNASAQKTMALKAGWAMQSSLGNSISGEQASQPGYKTTGWYKVSVPTSIIAGLLANHVYDFDPFYDTNLARIAGPQFDTSWWFRKEFTLPAAQTGKNVVITMHGINYKANIWFNGALIADTDYVKGPFRFFEFDVTKYVKFGRPNVLAVEVTRPFNPNRRGGDLAIDYADWIHYPADYNGGIINNVTVNMYDKVAVLHPFVETKFDLPSLKNAHLTVYADVVNYADKPVDAVVKGRINKDITFSQKVHLDAKQRTEVRFTPEEYTQLNITNPKVWWPWQFGKPNLNHIEVSAVIGEKTSNTIAEHFGIREMTSQFITSNAREFIVNGKPMLMRGAAWSPDIFQRRSAKRQEQEMKLVRDMNINLVRSEGKFEDDNFYDLCDKKGFLVMTGWMCCGAWQYPERWTPAKRVVAMASDSSMMYWLRNRACILTWLNGSDMPPRDTSVERDYLTIEANLHFPNPILSTANGSDSKVSGPSGVKMAGPYEWVPPSYWEQDTDKVGGPWSFATEISPGPAIPPYESLVKFLPKDSISNSSKSWQYHAGTMQFGNTNIFDTALYERYGTPVNMKDYIEKAQAQNYEAERAMMEAYGLYKHKTATGVVQWMMSNPWPGIIWHTYDYYLYPAGTYFGMKKSLEPLHVQYSYKSKEVIVNNSLLNTDKGLKVKADIYNIDGAKKYSNTAEVNIGSDTVARCFAIPAVEGLSSSYFLRLQLLDKAGKSKSINWYWLSLKNDELNFDKSKWYYTPESSYTDYTALQQLPKTTITVSNTTMPKTDSTTQVVTLTNAGKAVAFFVHVRVTKGKGGDDILPVIFSDNYISLAPGETRQVTVTYNNKDAENATPYFVIEGWNVDTNTSTQTANTAVVAANK
ncbi:MAG TPA: glycoside hydrolase family 2 protein [Chitinophagaceae bacterium]|nr:glycoside hydrolase family 2 protein [Chitinophagaceae bacterium]